MADRLTTGGHQRLTEAPSIETSPSLSPDGSQIVFESDRSGTQQIYIMPVGGGEPQRISFGEGRYGSPVWSPRGDLIAFTKQNAGRFHIGVMRTDGSEERLLTSSFLDESPTWAPNGRVIMFTRETQGETADRRFTGWISRAASLSRSRQGAWPRTQVGGRFSPDSKVLGPSGADVLRFVQRA